MSKITFGDYKNKISEDIKKKGFSFVDDKVLTGIEENEKKDKAKFIQTLKEKEKYGRYSIQKGDKDSPDDSVYFIYDQKQFKPERVTSVVSLLSLVMDYDDNEVNRYFRGQKAHYDLIPSLFRHKEWVEKEMELNARVYNDRPKDFVDCNSTFDKLVRLKHYDHPSRLLDLTASPLVALFFACFSLNKEEENRTGLISEAYCNKKDEKISVSSDTVVLLTAMTNTSITLLEESRHVPCIDKENIKIVPKDFSRSCFKTCLAKKNEIMELWKLRRRELKKSWDLYIGEVSHQCKKEGMSIYWDDLCCNELNQCILVRPPLNTDRIVRQQGCFIMCGMNPQNVLEPPVSLYDFFKPKDERKATFYYILPADREPILKELKKLGMDEYFFFPELEREIKVLSDEALDAGMNTENDNAKPDLHENDISATEIVYGANSSET